jgi:hypothetical protein
MTSISLNLYIPSDVSSNEISQYLSSSHAQDISPPFQQKYQRLIRERYGNVNNYRIEKFQVDFPRGPVRCYHAVHTASTQSSTHNIVDRINEAFRRNLSMPMSQTRTSSQNRLPTSTTTINFKCAICLDECVTGQRQQILPCMHKFHSACIGTWLSNSNKCPTCRHDVLPEISRGPARPSRDILSSDERMFNLINNIRNI